MKVFEKRKINHETFLHSHTNEEKLKFLVRLAALAPSSHNTQPWKFKIEGLSILVYPDYSRALSNSDKKHRQLFISIGAAIENLVIASRCFSLEFHINSDQASGEVARIIYKDLESKVFDPELFGALIRRHNNRFPFDDSNIPSNFLEKVKSFRTNSIEFHIISDQLEKQQAREVIENAVLDCFLDKDFTSELSQWIKPGLKKYRLGMPGYNLQIPFLISFLMPWMIRNMNLTKMQVKMNREQLLNCPAYVVLTSIEDTIESWMNVGMLFEEVAVEAEKNNIKIGILTAAIEMNDYYLQLQRILNTDSRPQLFFRLGYTDKIPSPSPRLDISEIIF